MVTPRTVVHTVLNALHIGLDDNTGASPPNASILSAVHEHGCINVHDSCILGKAMTAAIQSDEVTYMCMAGT